MCRVHFGGHGGAGAGIRSGVGVTSAFGGVGRVRASVVTVPTMTGRAKRPGPLAAAVEENRTKESNRGAGHDFQRTLVTCRKGET